MDLCDRPLRKRLQATVFRFREAVARQPSRIASGRATSTDQTAGYSRLRSVGACVLDRQSAAPLPSITCKTEIASPVDRNECDLKSVALSSTAALDARVKRTHPGTLREILATNVRRIRAEKGLSQDALADLCEIDRTYISGIERGLRNLSIDTLERLARGLRLEPWQLIRRPDADR